MIATFKHKALRRLFEDDDRKGLNADHIERLRLILLALESADDIAVLNLPSFRLHPLIGNLKGHWSITVRANWRIVFRFVDGQAFDIDLIDYH